MKLPVETPIGVSVALRIGDPCLVMPVEYGLRAPGISGVKKTTSSDGLGVVAAIDAVNHLVIGLALGGEDLDSEGHASKPQEEGA